MNSSKKLLNTGGGYIFLSHSHSDIKEVRKIRNKLEEDGFEPLCFYLKCLSDDSEIEDLIKREIDAREWFVFLDSENARKSKWVTLEREYITTRDSKKIIHVDLADAQAVDQALNIMRHNLRVFVGSVGDTESLAERIKEQLEAKDYLVFHGGETCSVGMEDPIVTAAHHAYLEAVREGAVVLLLPVGVDTWYGALSCMEEARLAGNLFPVFVGDGSLPPHIDYLFRGRKKFFLPTEPTEKMIGQLVDQISWHILSKFHTSADTN